MSEEVTQESSPEQTTSIEAPTVVEATPLEKVYSDFNIEAEAQSFQPQQRQAPALQQQAVAAPQMPVVPDPVLDPQGFSEWQNSQSTELRTKLANIEGFQRQMMVAEINRRDAEETKTLVSDINKTVGLPDEDSDLIEFALAKQVRTDQKFASIYQNRHKNPKAWSAATKAVGDQLQKKFSVRADPQLAENQRAIKQSQQAMATTKQSDPNEDRFSGKTGAAFDREWQSYIGRGTL